MANTAFMTMYRDETIAAFEAGESLLRQACTTEAMVSGQIATFLVAGSGGATATTRGVNGLIPAGENDLVQVPITMTEWHKLIQMNNFNIFASQGNQRSIMQKNVVKVINRKIDDQILTELATGTVNTGAATTGSLPLVLKAAAILQLAEVPWDMNIMGVISPSFHAYLLNVAAYTSADYVDLKPMANNTSGWTDRVRAKRWLDINWIVHPNVPGVGTSAEKCFLFHRDAIGHAMNVGGMDVKVGMHDEQDYSWARASGYMGTELLQNSGVVVMNHDGSAHVGS